MTVESYIAIAGGLIAVGAGVAAFVKYWYLKGKNEGSKETSSDNTHMTLFNKVGNLESQLDNFTKKNDDEHKLLFSKVNAIKQDITIIKTDSAYMKGKIDEALRHK